MMPIQPKTCMCIMFQLCSQFWFCWKHKDMLFSISLKAFKVAFKIVKSIHFCETWRLHYLITQTKEKYNISIVLHKSGIHIVRPWSREARSKVTHEDQNYIGVHLIGLFCHLLRIPHASYLLGSSTPFHELLSKMSNLGFIVTIKTNK